LTNVGSGIVTGVSITDTSTLQFTGVANDLNPPISIVFDAPPDVAGEFSIFDISGAVPVLIAGGISGYIPNQDNDMLALAGAPFNAFGYEITLAGEPQPGDSFDFTYNINGTGNNENVALFGELQQLTVLDNGSSNFQQAFSRIIGRVGVSTQTAQIQRDAAESILFQSKERRESLSGVNLDEEAANLLKFQQAYQASAEIISVARTLFQTVLNAVQ
jgi:flagellar hook-associated protein 1 FlgK